MKPNVDIYVYRRCYTPGEKVQMRLSGFNVPAVQFAAYRLDLGAVVETSKTLENFGKTLKALNLYGHAPAAVWRFPMGKTYPDQWAERAVNVPHLPPGAYLIQARAGGVEKRTWLAVTRVALLAKRSRQETAGVRHGRQFGQAPPRPVPGAGRRARAAREGGDRCRRRPARADSPGRRATSGCTARRGAAPPSPSPASRPRRIRTAVYTVTDRPIYRPGHKVQYKATIRPAGRIGLAPGGFLLSALCGQARQVEIRDATDALVARRTVTTNAFGSLSGDFQLAGEPTLGDWQLERRPSASFHAYGGFDVEAYRKPEMTASVTFDKPHYLGGTTVPVTFDAQYYFGQPVANAPVHIQHRRSPARDAEPPYRRARASTDAQGNCISTSRPSACRRSDSVRPGDRHRPEPPQPERGRGAR